MVPIIIQKKDLKAAVKESVREVLSQEIMKLHALLTFPISKKEQKNIEDLYGAPTRKAAKSMEVRT